MANRFVERIAAVVLGLEGFRIYPTAVPIQHDNATGQLKTLDQDGATIKIIETAAVPQTLASGSLTITPAMAGKTIIATEAGVQTFTLPNAATMPGARLTLINGNAGGEILITPSATGILSIKGLVDHSTSVVPAAGTGVKNTAATNVLGDHITIESDGVLTWHEVAGAGIWASQ